MCCSILFSDGANRRRKGSAVGGFTLVEVVVTVAVFGIIMSGVYAAYLTQLEHSGREYHVAEGEIELGILKKIFERDLNLAGYGLAVDYGTTGFAPRPIDATNSDTAADVLLLAGTALGTSSRAAATWSYIEDAGSPVEIEQWSDPRENVQPNDRIILMEPNTKEILTLNDEWLFEYLEDADGDPLLKNVGGDELTDRTVGTLIYGLTKGGGASLPYYSVEYRLGGTSPKSCAPGTQSLLRAESANADPPPSSARDPLLACVLDLQVEFGLDTNEDGTLDTWDHGGTTADTYDVSRLRRRLKQVRIFLLVQSGARDPDYNYPSATVRNGDAGLGANGRLVSLSDEQRRYRWRVVSVIVTPRNL